MHESVRAFAASGPQRAATRLATVVQLAWFSHAALVAVVSLLVARALGAGTAATPDSTNYLSAALHLLHGDGYVTGSVAASGPPQFAPLALFPPAMSLAIAALLALGCERATALSAIASAAYLGYALASFWLLRSALPHARRWLAVPLALLLALLPPVRESLVLSLSDLPGAALALLSGALLLRSPQRGPRALVWLGLALGLSVAVRWANLYVAASACLLWLLCCSRGLSPAQRLLRLTALAGPIVALVGPLWLRNLLATGTLMGERPLAMSDPLAQLAQALAGLTGSLSEVGQSLAGAPALVAVHTLLGFALLGCWLSAALVTRDRRARLALGLAAGYLLAMVLSSSVVRYDPLNDGRFWLLVPPLLVAGTVRVLATMTARPLRRLLLVGTLLLAGHAAAVSATNVVASLGVAPYRGYFEPHLDGSPVLERALALHDAGLCELATNEQYLLLPRIGVRPVRFFGQDELPVLSQPGALCFVAVADARLPWTLEGEPALLRHELERLAARGQFTRISSDGVADLYRSATPRALSRVP